MAEIKFNPSFPGACTSEMTFLVQVSLERLHEGALSKKSLVLFATGEKLLRILRPAP